MQAVSCFTGLELLSYAHTSFIPALSFISPGRSNHRYKRGTAEQWIKEGKYALNWTRLSCHDFIDIGEHVTELIVNDGIDDSEPNEVVITVIEPMESHLWIFPSVIHRHNHGLKKIIALVSLPEGITKEQIGSNEPLMLYPGGIEAVSQYVFDIRSDGERTQHAVIFALFDEAELLDAVPDNGPVELQVVGRLKTGQYFYGFDTVTIKR